MHSIRRYASTTPMPTLAGSMLSRDSAAIRWRSSHEFSQNRVYQRTSFETMNIPNQHLEAAWYTVVSGQINVGRGTLWITSNVNFFVFARFGPLTKMNRPLTIVLGCSGLQNSFSPFPFPLSWTRKRLVCTERVLAPRSSSIAVECDTTCRSTLSFSEKYWFWTLLTKLRLFWHQKINIKG